MARLVSVPHLPGGARENQCLKHFALAGISPCSCFPEAYALSILFPPLGAQSSDQAGEIVTETRLGIIPGYRRLMKSAEEEASH